MNTVFDFIRNVGDKVLLPLVEKFGTLPDSVQKVLIVTFIVFAVIVIFSNMFRTEVKYYRGKQGYKIRTWGAGTIYKDIKEFPVEEIFEEKKTLGLFR